MGPLGAGRALSTTGRCLWLPTAPRGCGPGTGKASHTALSVGSSSQDVFVPLIKDKHNFPTRC